MAQRRVCVPTCHYWTVTTLYALLTVFLFLLRGVPFFLRALNLWSAGIHTNIYVLRCHSVFWRVVPTAQITINLPCIHLMFWKNAPPDSTKAIRWLMEDVKTPETIVTMEKHILVPQIRHSTILPRTNTWKGHLRAR